MSALTAEFVVVTPLFLGESSHEGAIEVAKTIRPPSVKGALRFWWRAFEWKHCLAEHPIGVEAALRLLHQRENVLWGSAAHGNQGGQGRLLLTTQELESSGQYKNPSFSQQYLLGQGLWQAPNERQGRPGQLLRDVCKTSRFKVSIVFKPHTSEQEIESVVRALLLWGMLGGLGSRSRKGFGSVAIQSLKYSGNSHLALEVPQNSQELVATLNGILTGLPNDLPPFTAFSSEVRIDCSLVGKNALSLLDKAGDELQFYRSNGQNGIIRNQQANRIFWSDHQIAQQASLGTHITTSPRRIVFGLPHNYYFSSTNSKLEVTGNFKERDRRASPLFIHIHRFPNGEHALLQSLIPARFLPVGEKVKMKSKHKSQHVAPAVDWSVITDYLDRFSAKYPTGGFQRII